MRNPFFFFSFYFQHKNGDVDFSNYSKDLVLSVPVQGLMVALFEITLSFRMVFILKAKKTP